MDPRCVNGRKEMTLTQRLAHFAKCQHPDCLKRKQFYKEVEKYVKENINKSPKSENFYDR